MNKKQKSGVILGSLASIAIAGTVIAGSTYALFTSESKTNIAVTSGIVDVSATIGDLETFSGVDLTGDPENDTIEATAVKGVFTNGGTASIGSDGALELTNVTPGDKATFKIEVSNKSNVTIKYRTVISTSNDTGLFSGLSLTVGDYQFDGTTYKTNWTTLEPSKDVNVASLNCVTLLPSDAGNEYQEKSCKVNYSVEAVQGNAYTEDKKFITLSLSSEDESKGSVNGGGTVKVGDEISITATPLAGYAFKGWYEGENLISSENPYTFAVPSSDVTYVAKFISEAEQEELNKKLGITPVVDLTNKTVTYGLYPQSYVSDTSLTATLDTLTPESNGWVYYNDQYYVKKTANPCSDEIIFDDETTIKSNTDYWFKCELIKWNLLASSESEGKYTLVTSALLDAHSYSLYSAKSDSNGAIAEAFEETNGYKPNNYEKSLVRAWLNDEFYKTAFNLNSSYIQTTEVDNSVSTTRGGNNASYYVCNNTQDKVYLLSYQDYLNTDYGFSSDALGSSSSGYSTNLRVCKTTDYARANGIDYNDTNYFTGWYWTRSPYTNDSSQIEFVTRNGQLTNTNLAGTTQTEIGVRAAITIKI